MEEKEPPNILIFSDGGIQRNRGATGWIIYYYKNKQFHQLLNGRKYVHNFTDPSFIIEAMALRDALDSCCALWKEKYTKPETEEIQYVDEDECILIEDEREHTETIQTGDPNEPAAKRQRNQDRITFQ